MLLGNITDVVDCSAVLHMAAAISGDACAAARATIRAAEIQAKAARHAGSLTLAAGLGAVAAAGGAIWAAHLQARLTERQERVRTKAFCRHLRVKAGVVPRELKTCWQHSKGLRWNVGSFYPGSRLNATKAFMEEIAPQAWPTLMPAGELLALIDRLYLALSAAVFQLSTLNQLYREMPPERLPPDTAYENAVLPAEDSADQAVTDALEVLDIFAGAVMAEPQTLSGRICGKMKQLTSATTP